MGSVGGAGAGAGGSETWTVGCWAAGLLDLLVQHFQAQPATASVRKPKNMKPQITVPVSLKGMPT